MHRWGELSWAIWGPDSDNPRSSWKGGLCERTGPSLFRGNRRIEQEDFPKKKKTHRGTLGNSPAATAPVSSLPRHPTSWGVCAPTRRCPHLISEGTETTHYTQECAQQPGSVRIHRGLWHDQGVSATHLGGN